MGEVHFQLGGGSVRRVTITVICGLVLVLTVTSGCSKSSPPKRNRDIKRATIGATTLPACAPIYVAEKKGFFEAEGLDATIRVYAAGALALGDVAAGKLDYATAAQTPIARAGLMKQRIDIVMSISEVDKANYIVARRDRGITKAADLEGKRVAFVPGTTGEYFLHIYLTTSRIPGSKVREVPIEPAHSANALLSGRVDAVSTWSPFTTEVESELGQNAVILDEPGLYTMYWSVLTGPKTPDIDTTRRLVRATARAVAYMADHEQESIEITARKCNMEPAALARQWDDYEWTTSLNQTLLLALEDEGEWMVAEKKVRGATKLPDYLEFINARALRAERPRDVTIIDAPSR